MAGRKTRKPTLKDLAGLAVKRSTQTATLSGDAFIRQVMKDAKAQQQGRMPKR